MKKQLQIISDSISPAPEISDLLLCGIFFAKSVSIGQNMRC